jgi:ABC-type sugar transport system substrate-binding protein
VRRILFTAVLAIGLLSGAVMAHAAEVRMFVHHKVTSYATWRKAYDAFDATRKKLGVTAQAVYRVDGDPNDVVVTHDFATMEKAKAFAASPELKETMQKAGVAGPPTIWFTTKADK